MLCVVVCCCIVDELCCVVCLGMMVVGRAGRGITITEPQSNANIKTVRTD